MSWKLNIVLVASIVVLASSGRFVSGFNDNPPRYNFATLPKTSFSCTGRVTGRYYADAELECQAFHVCVKGNGNSVQDFKFICPNGTTFDQEHQVCMDYYQVVCHEDIGTNPYGNIYELMKLSSNPRSRTYDLESGKISFLNPEAVDRNTLGDDFQVEEYNNNPLAASQNSLNFQNSKQSRKPSEDIFFKTFASTKYTPRPTTPTTTTTTTSRPVTKPSTTAAPLLFRSPISTSAPAAKRKPNLETYESYEIESVAGLTPQNSFNRLSTDQQSYKNYDYSYESQDPAPSSSSSTTTSSTTTTTTTTHKPQVFHNTYRSPFPASSSTAIPQTFQQQASRFNEDFFRKLPSSTETSVSKAAQFYVNSNTKYNTPEFRHPTTNPFKSTTEVPQSRDYRFPAIHEPVRVSSQNSRGLTNRGSVTFENSGFYSSPRTPVSSDPVVEYEQPKTSRPYTEDVIRPRNLAGTTNVNQVSNNRQNHRDNFAFSPVPPPTTAEPKTYPTTTFPQVNSFQKITTTAKPDKYSIFFSKSTTAPNKNYSEREPQYQKSSRASTADYYGPTSTYRPISSASLLDLEADFGQKSGSPSKSTNLRTSAPVIIQRSTTTTTTTTTQKPTESTTTVRPRQRTAHRRRVHRPRQQHNNRKFDPELKYSRRIDPIQDSKDEIFDAEASVFQGRPVTNLFQDEKVSQKAQVTKPSGEESPKLAENFGRKIKVNSIRRQFVTPRSEASTTTSTARPPIESSTHGQRRLIKRLKLKTTTAFYEASTTELPSTTEFTTAYPTTTNEPFYVSASTLRPVKRIQVKTKVVGRKYEKNSEFRVPPEIGSFSAYDKLRKIAATSTTSEPELVTISDEEFLLKKLKKYSHPNDEFTTPTTYKPFGYQQNSSVVIRVTQKTQKSAIPTPISFKEPILPNKNNKIEKKESLVEVTKSVREESTKSPDYDYAYYNSDDDYTDATRNLDKNYGKKPVKKALA